MAHGSILLNIMHGVMIMIKIGLILLCNIDASAQKIEAFAGELAGKYGFTINF